MKHQKEEPYLPPDNGDICWTIGAKEFSRKEVWYLLWTQRSMIANDMKNEFGKEISDEMIELLNNPRKPIY